MARHPHQAEFGDFQTPADLAAAVCAQLPGSPAAVLEPTCGRGAFLVAAQRRFPRARLTGLELNRGYLDDARRALGPAAELLHQDFFAVDWARLVAAQPEPLLVLGNPPWVTNSTLGGLESQNLPTKTNFQSRRGVEAITGASNFDISEWMGITLLEALSGRDATVALLLKSAVARKLLKHAWRQGLAIRDAAIFRVNARRHFGARVEACLLRCRTDRPGPRECAVWSDLSGLERVGQVGADAAGGLVADVAARRRTAHLAGASEWRSGVKHDCAKVLELRRVEGALRNGLGEAVDVEPEVLFPLLKSSDVAQGRLHGDRWMLLPQTRVGQDTRRLAARAPKAWSYLTGHGERFARRRSSIYRDRPPFAVFGVGDYSLTPWKIAISGLYKRLHFQLVPPRDGRPVVFDDTVYLTPCADEAEARAKLALLESPLARDFLASYVFWDAKRPVTARILRRLDFAKLGQAA